jgi:hypothetical protein
MNLIRNLLTAGAITYIVIALWQMAVHTGITVQTIAIILLLAGVTGVFWVSDESLVKRFEMALIWCMVLLFGLYLVYMAFASPGAI